MLRPGRRHFTAGRDGDSFAVGMVDYNKKLLVVKTVPPSVAPLACG